MPKYIDHPHKIDGKPLRAIKTLQNEIFNCFKDLLAMKSQGINLFFADIDKIKEIMLEELKDN